VYQTSSRCIWKAVVALHGWFGSRIEPLVLYGRLMPGKRVQFDDETWEAIKAVSRTTGKDFQELASAAFANLLKEHNQPGL
jgi:hypothetical protein